MYMPGAFEWVIIFLVVLILFGAGKLPEVGRSLGSAINEFKSSVKPKDETKPEQPKKEGE
jgi:sec-independent protein translocase protein TatA